MQNMQISEFLCLLGHSSGSAGTLGRRPREMAPHGHFGHSSIAGCSLSGWVRVSFLRFFTSSTVSVPAGSAISHILIPHISNF